MEAIIRMFGGMSKWRWAGRISSVMCGMMVLFPDIKTMLQEWALGSIPIGTLVVTAAAVMSLVYTLGVIWNSW